MEDDKIQLREMFYSITNIEIKDKQLTDYEKWLESIKVKKINKEVIAENIYLRNKMEKALDIIYEGISSNMK